MPRVFIGNFDFEHELAEVARPNAMVLRRDLASVWLPIAEPGDAIHDLSRLDDAFVAALKEVGLWVIAEKPAVDATLVPWGWAESVRELAEARGWNIDAPPQTAVQTANSRRFSAQLEAEFGTGIPGSCVIESVDELQELLSSEPPDRWVIKAEFSMSARERVLGRGEVLEDATANWLERRLRENGVAFFEPWVDILTEAGVQFDLSRSGEATLVGVTELLTADSGTFMGCVISSGQGLADGWSDSVATADRVAERLHQIGYFGPFGIDAATYSANGPQLRPIQDLNTRYTMGRLALGFRRILEPDEMAAWLFVPWDALPGEEFCGTLREQIGGLARLVRTSPYSNANGDAVRLGTLLLVANDRKNLREATRIAVELSGRSLRNQ